MKKDVIYLMDPTITQNEVGDNIEGYTFTKIFAEKKSVRQSEFYQAMNNGLKPEVVFVVRRSEYNGEESLAYDGKEYAIIRTYEKRNYVEITAQKVGDISGYA